MRVSPLLREFLSFPSPFFHLLVFFYFSFAYKPDLTFSAFHRRPHAPPLVSSASPLPLAPPSFVCAAYVPFGLHVNIHTASTSIQMADFWPILLPMFLRPIPSHLGVSSAPCTLHSPLVSPHTASIYPHIADIWLIL